LNETDAGLPAAGSSFYYASLYFPPAVRNELRLLEALRRAITSVPAQCSDRGVAHVKLAWWREEISGLADGRARHALTRALLPLAARQPALPAAFGALVAGTDDGLGAGAPVDDAALHAQLTATHGGVLGVLAACAGAPLEDDTLALAVSAERARTLHCLHDERRDGLLPVSATSLTRHGLSAAAVRHGEQAAALRALLGDELAALHSHLHLAIAALPRPRRRRQRLFITLARIAARHLELTLQDDCRVLERRLETTPLERLWIAWRTARWG